MDARLEADLVEAALQFPEQMRELRETLQDLRGNTQSASTITISAGNITNAVALVASATAIVLFGLFAVWTMLQLSTSRADMQQAQQDSRDREQAWIARWNNEIATLKAKKAD